MPDKALYVPHIIKEIRYYSTYNFVGDRRISGFFGLSQKI